MTLRDKFNKAICRNFTINQLEKIADDYAIEFAEWCLNYTPENIVTSKQLLEIFKKEKGL